MPKPLRSFAKRRRNKYSKFIKPITLVVGFNKLTKLRKNNMKQFIFEVVGLVVCLTGGYILSIFIYVTLGGV